MENRMSNLRLFFPAEVTASYLAVVELLEANKIGPGEFDNVMLFVAFGLALCNIGLYMKFQPKRPWPFYLTITLGFFVWVMNIDTLRFRDVDIIGSNIELIAPILLVFYTLITSIVALPKWKAGNPAPTENGES